jgi:chromosome partitioning protein
MHIALLAKKGGVGKSTVSLLLYEAFRHAGKTVSIHDWDTQGTSTKAVELIDGSRDNLNKRAEIVLFDTPPSLTHTATAAAVRAADIVLVLTSPSPADIWEADDAIRFAQEKNPKANIRLVFNKVRRSTVLGRLIAESASQVAAPTLGVSLSSRECYQHAVARGWRSLDGPAREEVLQLAVAVLSLNTAQRGVGA